MGSTHYGILRNIWDNVPGIGWWLVFFVSLIIYSNIVNGLWRNDKTRTAGYWLKGVFWVSWCLLLLWKFGLFGNFHFGRNHAPGHVFSWTKLFWRLGLSVVMAILWYLSFQRIRSGKHLVNLLYTTDKPDDPDLSYQLISMVVILIGVLTCIVLPSFVWLGFTITVIGVGVHLILPVPRRERWVPALLGDGIKTRTDLVTQERFGGSALSYFDTGWNLSAWLSLLPFITYLRFLHTKSPLTGQTPEFQTRESSSEAVQDTPDDDINITGAPVTVFWLLEDLEINKDPSVFLNAGEKFRKDILGAVSNIVNSFIQWVCKDLNYKEVLAWQPNEAQAQELTERLLRGAGVGFGAFKVVDVNSPAMEKASTDLATSRAAKQKEKLDAVADAARDAIRAGGANVAYKLRVDGAVMAMGLDPATATPAQRAEAIALMNSVSIAENPNYLVPPGGAASGINLLVQAPTAPKQR